MAVSRERCLEPSSGNPAFHSFRGTETTASNVDVDMLGKALQLHRSSARLRLHTLDFTFINWKPYYQRIPGTCSALSPQRASCWLSNCGLQVHPELLSKSGAVELHAATLDGFHTHAPGRRRRLVSSHSQQPLSANELASAALRKAALIAADTPDSCATDLHRALQAIRDSDTIQSLHAALRHSQAESVPFGEKNRSPDADRRAPLIAAAVRTKLASWPSVPHDRQTGALLSDIVEWCTSAFGDVSALQPTDKLAFAKALASWTPWIRWLRPETVTRLYRTLEQVYAAAPALSLGVYSALWKCRVQALGYLRWPQDLDECFDVCRRYQCSPDIVLLNTVLDGLCNGPRGGPFYPTWRRRQLPHPITEDEPLGFLERFLERIRREWQIEPDRGTLNIMLEFLGTRGCTEEMLGFYDRWVPSPYALGKETRHDAGFARLVPDAFTFRVLFRGLDPRWRPSSLPDASRHSWREFFRLADRFLPRIQSRWSALPDSERGPAPAREALPIAEVEAFAYNGKGAQVLQILRGTLPDAQRLVVPAIRGLAYNARAVRLADYAFTIYETYVRRNETIQEKLTPQMLRSILDALLVASDRTHRARTALDLFHVFANGEIAATTVLPSHIGVRALIRAHCKAPAVLWPALAECLAIVSAEGIHLDPDAMHRLERHYAEQGATASTARQQVQRIMRLLFDLER